MNKKTILIGLGVLAVAGAGIGYYMWKKKNEKTTTNSSGGNTSGGDASEDDDEGQKYTLLEPYKAINTKTMKDVSFNKGDNFLKKNIKNATNINTQPAVKVFSLPIGTDEYVIPTNILKKNVKKDMSTETTGGAFKKK